MRSFFALGILALTSACTYSAQTNISPSFDVYSNYDDKLPFRIALFVEADRMQEVVKVSGFNCSAHTYPFDARDAFRVSTVKTLENLVEGVEVVDAPLNQGDLNSRSLDAMVVVRVDDVDVDLTVIPGFWSAEMEADTEITASITADTRDGRALGTTVEGSDDARVDAGAACEGGANAIGKSVEAAMKETLQRLGERITNSVRLREEAKRKRTS